MDYIIGGIQQLGVGTPDETASCIWYKQVFGMEHPIFREAAPAPYMTRYTGGEVQSRSATLAVNLQGGSGFEIWQYTSRKTEMCGFTVEPGDLGITMGKIKTLNADLLFDIMKDQAIDVISESVSQAPDGSKCFYIRDPWKNIFQILEQKDYFKKGKHPSGGPCGAFLGVSDMQKSLPFYQNLLGYDQVVSDSEGVFEDFKGLPGGDKLCRRVILKRSTPAKGPFAPVFGESSLELVQFMEAKGRPVFEGRFWGDGGFIHLCFDIVGMKDLGEKAAAMGHPFTVNSEDSFNMGEAAGHFTYVEDPDGTLIEFVETHKIPLVKKWNWYMDLTKRAPGKSLPKWMLSLMKTNTY